MLYKIILLALSSLVLFVRPLYSVFMLFLLCAEYYFIVESLFLIKTSQSYRRLNTSAVVNADRHIVDL